MIELIESDWRCQITNFAKTNRWQQANTVIQDGLLGTEGSAFIAELERGALAFVQNFDAFY